DAAANDQLATLQLGNGRRGNGDVVINHDGVGGLDFPGQVRLGGGIEGDDVGNIAEYLAFGGQGIGQEIGNDDAKARHKRFLGELAIIYGSALTAATCVVESGG